MYHSLKHHQAILKLDLTGCGITKNELDVISHLLHVNTKIQYLAIANNEFSTLNLIDFVRSLQNNHTLQELRVDERHFYKFCCRIETLDKTEGNILVSRVVDFDKLFIMWL